MYEQLVILGIIAILAGFVLIVLGFVLGASKSSSTSKTEWGFFGIIGPFPIGFGSSKNSFLLAASIAIAVFAIFTVLNALYR